MADRNLDLLAAAVLDRPPPGRQAFPIHVIASCVFTIEYVRELGAAWWCDHWWMILVLPRTPMKHFWLGGISGSFWMVRKTQITAAVTLSGVHLWQFATLTSVLCNSKVFLA